MLRTGAQYRDSLRDGRQVWMNGERVKDVAAHPAFKPIVDIRARIYDMAHEARYKPIMAYAEGNQENCIGYKLPHSPRRLGAEAPRHRCGDEGDQRLRGAGRRRDRGRDVVAL